MDSCFTHNGMQLLSIVLPPLRDCTRFLESQLDPSKQHDRDFYRHFDGLTRVLLHDLRRLQRCTASPALEHSANFVLTRLDEVVSEDIRKSFPETTVSVRDQIFFEYVKDVCVFWHDASHDSSTSYLFQSTPLLIQNPLTFIWRGLVEECNSKSTFFIEKCHAKM